MGQTLIAAVVFATRETDLPAVSVLRVLGALYEYGVPCCLFLPKHQGNASYPGIFRSAWVYAQLLGALGKRHAQLGIASGQRLGEPVAYVFDKWLVVAHDVKVIISRFYNLIIINTLRLELVDCMTICLQICGEMGGFWLEGSVKVAL